LAWISEHLHKSGVEGPRRCAEMLLAAAIGCQRMRLYMEMDRPASAAERDTLRGWVRRAAEHEPVDYLVGHSPFFAMDLHVGPAVLIPRPSTETLVEHVMQRVRSQGWTNQPMRLLDIGTGSGAIAVSLAKHLRSARVVATDLSEQALAIAKLNAQRYDVADRIEFRLGDLFEALDPAERFDWLLSNPPYISDAEWAEVPRNVKDYEPVSALRGGVDGMDLLRRLMADGPDLLEPGGGLALEIAAAHEDAMLRLAEEDRRLQGPAVLKDHEGLPRVLIAYRRNEPAAMRGVSFEAAAERSS
jgi:release factor glutamine methyltransferase